MAKRKTAEQTLEPAPETAAPVAPAGERQPGDEPETRRNFGPDPYPIDTDARAGARLLGSDRYFDRSLGRYAFRNVQIKFDEKPAQPVLDKIREAGFEWDRDARAWTKEVPSETAIRTRLDAEDLFKEVSGMLREAKGLGREKAPF